MKRILALSAALLLGGCVYNPYTGLWQPAGYNPYYGYGYGYAYRPYAYRPYYPYPYGYNRPPPPPQGGWQGSNVAPPPPPVSAPYGSQQPTDQQPTDLSR